MVRSLADRTFQPRCPPGAEDGADGFDAFSVGALLAVLDACVALEDFQLEAELKGSIGEGPNHSNFSHQSSVKVLSKFRNFR